MSNLINNNYANSLYLSSRQTEREDVSSESRTEKALSPIDRLAVMQGRGRDNEKKTEVIQKDILQKGDYRDLIGRVAEQEAKKIKLSAYTQAQQTLQNQVEKTISPQNNERSYDLKV